MDVDLRYVSVSPGDDDAEAPEFHRRRRRILVLGLRAAAVAVLITAWAITSRLSDLVPTIETTLVALWEGLVTSGDFRPDLVSTMEAVLIAVFFACIAAFASALVIGQSRFLRAIFDPIVNGLFSTPRIIVYPVFLAAFGVGQTAIAWVAFFTAYFPITVNGIAGVKDINPMLPKLGRSLCASRIQMARHILVPAAAPALMSAVRIGWSGAFLTVIAAEMFASRAGMGQLLFRFYSLRQYSNMFAIALVIVVIALLGNVVLVGIERQIRHST